MRLPLKTLPLFALFLLAAPAQAHEAKGPHGGRQVDAGQMHVEMVANGAVIDVYVSDAKGEPVDASGYKGLAILVVAGKPLRVPLASAGKDRLTGTAPVDVGRPKGAVQITSGGGATVQGKFD
ncbi:MAG: uncharacterized protein JWN93_3975 [Hyphomicrobiales bacterium]|nr:uncharacterized protein [Hyphomicrobiales bacterium]